MIKNKRLAFCFGLMVSMSFGFDTQAQFTGKNYDIEGFTKTVDIKVVNNHSETAGLIEIGEAFSKARGTTFFSPINRINSRARRKLLEEASVRGASHVWVLNRTTEGGFGRLVSYHAVFFRHPDFVIGAKKLEEFIQNGNLKPVQTLTADRNASGLKPGMISLVFKLDPSTIQVNDNRLYVDNKYLRGAEAKGYSSPFQRTFEVIGLNDEYIVLVEVLEEGKTYQARLYQKVTE